MILKPSDVCYAMLPPQEERKAYGGTTWSNRKNDEVVV